MRHEPRRLRTWLHWQQPIRWSRWLLIYLYASVPFVFVPPLLIEMHRNGGRLWQAYQTLGNQHGGYRIAQMLIFVDWAFLAWFVFFTKSKLVTDSDRMIVFIGSCGILIVIVAMAAHVL